MKKITIKKIAIGAVISLFGLGIFQYQKEKKEISIETHDLKDTLLIDSFELDSIRLDSVKLDSVKLDSL